MPNTPNWQPRAPIEAIVFDCDGTLSAIEGIDELAELNHVGEQVKAITAKAMGETGMNPDIYRERLQLVKPTREQVNHLGEKYYAARAPGCEEVISLLQGLHKNVFIASAGIRPAVSYLGKKLGVPESNIFAVDITFDAQGQYRDFDATSPLTQRNGKCDIVMMLKQQFKTIAFVGDGLNDLIAKDLVERFIGYGGAYYRPNIEAKCDFYIKEKSFLPLLPLLLTKEEYAS